MLAAGLGQPQEPGELQPWLITAQQLPLAHFLPLPLVCGWGLFKNDLSAVGGADSGCGL